MASSSSATRQGAWTDAQCERLLGRSQASRLATHGVEKYCRMLLGRPCVFICITYEGDATRHCELFDVLCRPAKTGACLPHGPGRRLRLESQGWLAQTLFFVLEGDWRPSDTAGGWLDRADGDGDRQHAGERRQCCSGQEPRLPLVQLGRTEESGELLPPQRPHAHGHDTADCGQAGLLACKKHVPFRCYLNHSLKPPRPPLPPPCRPLCEGDALAASSGTPWAKDQASHMDVWLLGWLKDNMPLESGWLSPSWGYSEHVSGCEETLQGVPRACNWWSNWRREAPQRSSKFEILAFKSRPHSTGSHSHRY